MPRQVVIIHGGTVYASRAEFLRQLKRARVDFDRLMSVGWKEGFGRKLGKEFQVIQPKMPNPNDARYEEWAVWFGKIVPYLKHGVVLVGHSLGGIFLAKYLATHRMPRQVRATVLIAAPFDDDDMDESLGDFALPRSLRRFARQGGKIMLCYSADDPVVPVAHGHAYQRALPQATLRIFPAKGHFNQSTFPELVRMIKNLQARQS